MKKTVQEDEEGLRLFKKTSIEVQKYVDSLKFEEFDIRKQLEDRKASTVFICAKRNTGKTFLTECLLSQIPDFYSEVFVFSMTANLQKNEFKYVPSENIFTGLDEEKLTQIWEQKKAQVQRMEAQGIAKNKMPVTLIIMDDLISDPKCRNSEILNRIYVAGRHVSICIFFISQTISSKYGITNVMKQNCDIVISFYLSNMYDRKALIEQFLSSRSAETGLAIFDKITHQQYNSICIANHVVDKNPLKYIFYYKGYKPKPFSIGNKRQSTVVINKPQKSEPIIGFIKSSDKKEDFFYN